MRTKKNIPIQLQLIIVISILLLFTFPLIESQTITPTDTEPASDIPTSDPSDEDPASTNLDTTTGINSTEDADKEPSLPESTKDAQELAKKAGEAASSALKEGAKETKIDKIEPLKLPSVLDAPARFVFGINDGSEVTLEKFIILIALFVIIFLVFLEIIKLTAFEEKWVKVVIGIVFLIPALFLGIINKIANTMLDISNLIGIFTSMKDWKIFVWIFGFVLAFFFLKWLVKTVKNRTKIDQARARGELTRAAAEAGEILTS
jgi:hypothetical protein